MADRLPAGLRITLLVQVPRQKSLVKVAPIRTLFEDEGMRLKPSILLPRSRATGNCRRGRQTCRNLPLRLAQVVNHRTSAPVTSESDSNFS